MNIKSLHALGTYYSDLAPLSVMDDFGNLVSLGFTEGCALQQWQYTVADRG